MQVHILPTFDSAMLLHETLRMETILHTPLPQAEILVQMHSGGGPWKDAVHVLVDPSGGYSSPSQVTLLCADADFMLTGHNAVVGSTFHMPSWPPFLLDLLPQWGRSWLIAIDPGFCTDPDAGASQSGFLDLASGSPIGNLRVRVQGHEVPPAEWTRPGWTRAALFELASQTDCLAGELADYAPGAFGLQGAWPKFLATRARDGLWYPDPVVADQDATEHAIVKWAADARPSTACVLACEAPYIELARWFGLRCASPLQRSNGILFIPRFDRIVQPEGKVVRLAQQSVAAVSGKIGFGVWGKHERYLWGIHARCADPARETVEYVLRDIFNLATGNTDNHGRNTSLQQGSDGGWCLSPLYDICPMALFNVGDPRATTWECESVPGLPDWAAVCRSATADGDVMPVASLARALAERAPMLRGLPGRAQDLGVPTCVVEQVMGGCAALADSLESIVVP
jgi:serine/threonine-protein kinase HipA